MFLIDISYIELCSTLPNRLKMINSLNSTVLLKIVLLIRPLKMVYLKIFS